MSFFRTRQTEVLSPSEQLYLADNRTSLVNDRDYRRYSSPLLCQIKAWLYSMSRLTCLTSRCSCLGQHMESSVLDHDKSEPDSARTERLVRGSTGHCRRPKLQARRLGQGKSVTVDVPNCKPGDWVKVRVSLSTSQTASQETGSR